MFEKVQDVELTDVRQNTNNLFPESDRTTKEKIDLYFKDLSYSVTIKYKASRCSFKKISEHFSKEKYSFIFKFQAKERQILNKLSGIAKSGELCAIMGASGF